MYLDFKNGEVETETGYKISLENLSKLSKKDRDWKYSDYVYQSNLIENIRTDIVQTITEGEEPEAFPEVDNHFAASEYVLQNYENNLSEDNIKNIHKTLMENLLENNGEYRKSKIWVGKKGCPYYSQVPKLMKNLEIKILNLNEKENIKLQDIWSIHNEFETIHPFSDGNGRTGRLIFNWLSLKYLKEFHIFHITKRETYYNLIREYKDFFKRENPNIKFYKDKTSNSNLKLFRQLQLLNEICF